MFLKKNNVEIIILKGDITDMATDAIVNAANEHLAHDGGVAGAIVRKGGAQIQQESDEWIKNNGIVKTGTAAITNAGFLKARYVIHAVGPVMGSGNEDFKLESATKSALQLAKDTNLNSIAFPAISTGIFGYPLEKCAHIMLKTALDFSKSAGSIKKIVFCLFDDNSFDVFKENMLKFDK